MELEERLIGYNEYITRCFSILLALGFDYVYNTYIYFFKLVRHGYHRTDECCLVALLERREGARCHNCTFNGSGLAIVRHSLSNDK